MSPDARRVEQHDKLNKGDIVKVKGHRGDFKVVWIDEFDNDRPAEVTVVGGASGHSAWRTFLAERIRPQLRKRSN